MARLAGRVAIITGAAMGIGEGIAWALARHGAHVVLWDKSEKVFATSRSIELSGLKASAYKVDVTHFKRCKQASDMVISEFGKVDILCNNAGVIRFANFLDTEDEARDFIFRVNIIGTWNCTKAVLPNMMQNRYGKIIIMSSVTGPMVADEGEVAYATTKAALWGFTKALAREVAAYGITVNAICPGIIRTPMVEQILRESNPSNPEAAMLALAQQIPLARLGNASEVGELAVFLASDASNYITGTQVVIDGGNTIKETVATPTS